MEKISVVIPSYNRGRCLVDSVESVLSQTYKNIEVIVVDDGSTDDTEEVVKSIKDKRFKYYRLTKNRGANYARMYGVKHAEGEYIAFQDSDDIFHKDKLEKQLKNIKKNNADFDFCKIVILNGDERLVVPRDYQEKSILKGELVTEMCRANFISTQAILLKKKIFDEIEFDKELPRFQDFDFCLRVQSKFKISYTKEVLVDLYRQDDSISSNDTKLKKACLLMLCKNYDLTPEQNMILKEQLAQGYNKVDIDNLNREIYFKDIEIEKYKKNQKWIETSAWLIPRRMYHSIKDKIKRV